MTLTKIKIHPKNPNTIFYFSQLEKHIKKIDIKGDLNDY